MHIKIPWSIGLLAQAACSYGKLEPNYTSPSGVQIFNPSTFFNTTGPWSLMSIAGDTLYISGRVVILGSNCFLLTCRPGMRGIYPSNSTLAPVGLTRVRQAYQNMAALAEMAGSDVNSCVRLVVYVTDMFRYRPMCNQAQVEIWGDDPSRYPPRTIVEVGRLNDDDIVEVEGTFYLGRSA
ncbi:YjgF-like protein [Annulohypoxylon maeteangense]|uniref:YjgF-like protein n=1 Tax=Annulohypoxylon maeteangense TaxID=1927788 RepID=UPI0020072DAC|nr:YjgF-like protein [Annulohypoxylon maeteangense]KAI0889742.1 YjgF-like protein [Annulohypoxylon maeteangense]